MSNRDDLTLLNLRALDKAVEAAEKFAGPLPSTTISRAIQTYLREVDRTRRMDIGEYAVFGVLLMILYGVVVEHGWIWLPISLVIIYSFANVYALLLGRLFQAILKDREKK